SVPSIRQARSRHKQESVHNRPDQPIILKIAALNGQAALSGAQKEHICLKSHIYAPSLQRPPCGRRWIGA
ncbi:hypothetical protein, partial [Mesorhizobium sp. M0118]|uniref:hypothetical protein n=1 Tax=Mesorhizobium sp. M0118 TaxID=2956884 RepID=UPI0033360A3D